METPPSQRWNTLPSPTRGGKPPPSPCQRSLRQEVPSYDKYYWNTSRGDEEIPSVLKIYRRAQDDQLSFDSNTLPRDRYTRKSPVGVSRRDYSPARRSLQDVSAIRDPSPLRQDVQSEAATQNMNDAQLSPIQRSLQKAQRHRETFLRSLSTDASVSSGAATSEQEVNNNLQNPDIPPTSRSSQQNNNPNWDGGLRRKLHRSTEDLAAASSKAFSDRMRFDKFQTSVRDSTEDLRKQRGTVEIDDVRPIYVPNAGVNSLPRNIGSSIPTTRIIRRRPVHDNSQDSDMSRNEVTVGDFTTSSLQSSPQRTPLQHQDTAVQKSQTDPDRYAQDYPSDVIHQQRQRALSVPVLPSPILKKVSQFARGGFSRSRKPSLKKQTSFKENVKIIHYDDAENMTITDSGPLREEKTYCPRPEGKATSGEVFTTELETSVRSVSGASLIAGGSSSKSGETGTREGQPNVENIDLLLEEARKHAQTFAGRCGTGPTSGDNNQQTGIVGSITSIFNSKNLEFLPGTVAAGGSQKQSRIRLLLRLGQGFIHSQTTVKALSGGSSLIVVTYRSSLASDGSIRLHQYREKLALPVKVDPYSMRAFMQKTGELHIEALVAS